MKLIVSGIILHLIFMASIFEIYFTTTIIHGMTPQKSDKIPAAKRLVFIVADGLRAESLFGDNFTNLSKTETTAPFLSSLIKSKAAWGISHTRVPTESRPGHVALTAGIYEDPSAIAKGWKENPVEFDSVFNESRATWAWGSPDIVPMFAKSEHVHSFSYSAEEEDFSGKTSTTLLDTWVFDRVEKFFVETQESTTRYEIQKDKVIFFLHLLGLDTAGHTHKPRSPEHTENIKVVDTGIHKIEHLITDFYNDGKTSFVFTSDHGMTDWGSHGAGSKSETETPFVMWGAGIAPSKGPIEITQADIAPLISTLIGIPIPINSVGVLPVQCLNLSDEDLASALLVNAKQIHAQYDEKRKRTEHNSIFWLYKSFPDFSTAQFQHLLTTIENAIKDYKFTHAMKLSEELIQKATKGLDYYQNYYQRLLLTCISLTYIGWIFLLIIYLTETTPDDKVFIPNEEMNKYLDNCIRNAVLFAIIHLIFFITMFITALTLYVQSLPLMYYVYCIIPQYIWWKIARKSDKWLPKVKDMLTSKLKMLKTFGLIILYLAGIESLVLCFFERQALGIALLVISVWPHFMQRVETSLKICWTLTCLILSVFPFLPVVGSTFNYNLIALTGMLWILFNFGLLIVPSALLNPQHFYIDRKQICMAVLQSLLLVIAIFNLYIVNATMNSKTGLHFSNQVTSWLLSGISLLLPFFGSEYILGRLMNIMMSFLVPFILLSVSYEPLFMLMLFLNLILWLAIEYKEYSPIYRDLSLVPFKPKNQRRILNLTRKQIYGQDFRRGYFIMLYVVLAFFGMGNMASVNSFDPMWVRNFLTVFSPFTMAALILFKILIPYLVVSCVFRAVTTCLQAPVQKIFFIVLVFCDIMGLHFLFMVKNYGSWLEIGSSISHFIIVQTMVLFLLLLYGVAIALTDITLFAKSNNFPVYTFKVHKR